MKRWIALFLILSLTLALFCGCKSGEKEDFSAESEGLIDVENEPGQKDETEKEPEKESEKAPDEEKKEPETEKEAEKTPSDTPSEKEETPEKEPEKSEEKEPEAITKESSGTSITFLMQNLRTSGNEKGVPGERENSENEVYKRARRFKPMVMKNDPDVILAQEGTPAWLEFFRTDEYFSSTYDMIWKYRLPGSAVEMSTPLLYKKNKYELLDSGVFWLSETPDVPSVSYEAGTGETHHRNSSWAKLRDKATGAVFYAYSTHFDTGGVTPIKSMEQYLEIFSKMKKTDYAFVGGDFNFKYKTAEYMSAVDAEATVDLQDMAANMAKAGLAEMKESTGSLTGGFTDKIWPDPQPGGAGQLDHIFAKKSPNMAIDYWGFDYGEYSDPASNVLPGYISDHYGLIAKVRIDTKPDYSQYQVEN